MVSAIGYPPPCSDTGTDHVRECRKPGSVPGGRSSISQGYREVRNRCSTSRSAGSGRGLWPGKAAAFTTIPICPASSIAVRGRCNHDRTPSPLHRRTAETFALEAGGLATPARSAGFLTARSANCSCPTPRAFRERCEAARDAAIVFSFAVQHGADSEAIRRALCRDSQGRASGRSAVRSISGRARTMSARHEHPHKVRGGTPSVARACPALPTMNTRRRCWSGTSRIGSTSGIGRTTSQLLAYPSFDRLQQGMAAGSRHTVGKAMADLERMGAIQVNCTPPA